MLYANLALITTHLRLRVLVPATVGVYLLVIGSPFLMLTTALAIAETALASVTLPALAYVYAVGVGAWCRPADPRGVATAATLAFCIASVRCAGRICGVGPKRSKA